MPTTQGLRSVIDKANAATEKRVAETFRFMEEQKIRKALAPNEWEKFKHQHIQECATLNQSGQPLQSDAYGVNELTLRNTDTGKSVKFTFNPDMPCVFYDGDDSGHFAFKPSADGMTLQWFHPKYKRVVTIGEIFFETIKYLIS
jgi:hypothetical protein